MQTPHTHDTRHIKALGVGLGVGIWGILISAPAFAQNAQDAAKVLEFFQVDGIIPALVYATLAVLILRFATAMLQRIGERFTEHRLLAQQIATIFRFVVYIAVFALVMRSLFRLERETMLALGGTFAVAVGFGLKDLAASVLAGITILFDRPFQVGDRVTFGEYYGEITSIGLRSVRMVTLDDSVVTVPNNKFLTDVVVSGNAGNLDMQIVMDFFIAQDADVMRAKRIVLEALKTSRFVYLSKPVTVLVNDLIHENYIATRLRAKAYVLDVRYEKAFETDVTERVKEGFTSANISVPTFRHIVSGVTPPTERSA